MDVLTAITLIGFAFTAGAIDAAVGGGGLVQIPGLMSTFPQMQPATVIGTNKLSSIFGTASAAYTFGKKVKLEWKLLAVIAICALVSAFAGAACLSLIPQSVLRPLVFILLIIIAVYTFIKKDFGQSKFQLKITKKVLIYAAIGSLIIGFYDGLFGPGTGSFFIFFFIRFLGVDFVHASALSKIGNFMTNFAALSFFIPTGHAIIGIGLMMAVANVIGSIVGVKVALKYGSGFVRKIFLVLVSVLIVRIGYQTIKG
ncbi:sulfite exporter TauE/SafE family protein [Acinetobacter pollinis]|uniref:sulfite exporter TauE/SafE family protein n=1 Tax=Acinetobacter pollinis TaxID=2605270 RepID=UPI0018A320C3|nr:TSUP family transporter [Acinetobacter pollinis]MBF7689773.1 TSUP family transporter [Acinetobacter pollinis]MBF7692276.1 TSUP family transporter [Acinetobacter pollinis]MBF7697115.1 TSUP family transporter [Acinetobacter pollinis]MBF7700167.1 TSUP family transporter [Acinetobacter pollinis]